MTELRNIKITSGANITEVTSAGELSVSVPTDHYIQRLDYSAANVPIYIGLAAPGTDVAAANWQIKQMSYDANSLVSGILFASGNTNFDKHWNARTSGPYS